VTLRLGAVLPQGELEEGGDALRAYALGLEQLGLEQLVAYDHVLGAGRSTRPDWSGYYSADDPFDEPLVTFAHLAAVATSLEFATCVLVLPQRQTALVAKQAAALQLLSDGRFRLGVGTGWNEVEYDGLGVPFADRGARMEEQIEVLRALWTHPTIDRETPFHRIRDAGINPRPPQPVPIWIGGGASPAALDRIARLADGWMVAHLDPEQAAPLLADLRRLLVEHGRDPTEFGVEARLYLAETARERWRAARASWAALGATRLNLVTSGQGLHGVDAHLAALRDALGVLA
jgi:probable F420-dependent oxidoreductase